MSRRSSGDGRTVNVRGYTRANGTYVAGYTRSAPSSRSSGVSSGSTGRSSASGSSARTVSVSGYTRSDGTYVAPHTRAAPGSRSSSVSSGSTGRSSASGSSARTVNVSGYTRSDGTYVAPHTRAAPGSKSGLSWGGTRGSSGKVHVKSYTRSDGTEVRAHTRSTPHASSSGMPSVATTSSSGQRCYVDNAYNRRLGRVGKPWGTHVVHRHGKKRELIEVYTVKGLVQQLLDVRLGDAIQPDRRYALDVLQKEQVEENWSKEGTTPSTDTEHLRCHIKCTIIPFDELHMEEEIGHGSFGVVYACKFRGTPVAFKKLPHQFMSRKAQENFVKEAKVLVSLSHPSIVQMFGAVAEEGNVGIVMEYMSRTLFHAIFVDCTKFPDDKKKTIVSQIAGALMYLHTREPKIAHCDIKSGNVLLDKDNDNAKLSDFGLSAVKNTAEASRSSTAAPPGQGTPRYSAPEVLRGELLTMSQLLMADIFSLAIVAFEVVAEEEPFEGLSVRQLETNVGRGGLRPSTIKLSQPLSTLLASSWDGSASKRPTAEEFYTEWNKISEYCQNILSAIL